ncbi:hypothetical protein DIPPA_14100 [Diplonema papillatum]|nr:hypothetical protein DIPPA_14100 [Diplonema papillatum]
MPPFKYVLWLDDADGTTDPGQREAAEGEIEPAGWKTSVLTVSLSGQGLSACEWMWALECVNLTYLDLSGNALKYLGQPKAWRQLCRLRCLLLHDNQLDDNVFTSLQPLSEQIIFATLYGNEPLQCYRRRAVAFLPKLLALDDHYVADGERYEPPTKVPEGVRAGLAFFAPLSRRLLLDRSTLLPRKGAEGEGEWKQKECRVLAAVASFLGHLRVAWSRVTASVRIQTLWRGRHVRKQWGLIVFQRKNERERADQQPPAPRPPAADDAGRRKMDASRAATLIQNRTRVLAAKRLLLRTLCHARKLASVLLPITQLEAGVAVLHQLSTGFRQVTITATITRFVVLQHAFDQPEVRTVVLKQSGAVVVTTTGSPSYEKQAALSAQAFAGLEKPAEGAADGQGGVDVVFRQPSRRRAPDTSKKSAGRGGKARAPPRPWVSARFLEYVLPREELSRVRGEVQIVEIRRRQRSRPDADRFRATAAPAVLVELQMEPGQVTLYLDAVAKRNASAKARYCPRLTPYLAADVLRLAGATAIQKAYRGHLVRARAPGDFMEAARRRFAAVAIQRAFRRYSARKRHHFLRHLRAALAPAPPRDGGAPPAGKGTDVFLSINAYQQLLMAFQMPERVEFSIQPTKPPCDVSLAPKEAGVLATTVRVCQDEGDRSGEYLFFTRRAVERLPRWLIKAGKLRYVNPAWQTATAAARGGASGGDGGTPLTPRSPLIDFSAAALLSASQPAPNAAAKAHLLSLCSLHDVLFKGARVPYVATPSRTSFVTIVEDPSCLDYLPFYRYGYICFRYGSHDECMRRRVMLSALTYDHKTDSLLCFEDPRVILENDAAQVIQIWWWYSARENLKKRRRGEKRPAESPVARTDEAECGSRPPSALSSHAGTGRAGAAAFLRGGPPAAAPHAAARYAALPLSVRVTRSSSPARRPAPDPYVQDFVRTHPTVRVIRYIPDDPVPPRRQFLPQASAPAGEDGTTPGVPPLPDEFEVTGRPPQAACPPPPAAARLAARADRLALRQLVAARRDEDAGEKRRQYLRAKAAPPPPRGGGGGGGARVVLAAERGGGRGEADDAAFVKISRLKLSAEINRYAAQALALERAGEQVRQCEDPDALPVVEANDNLADAWVTADDLKWLKADELSTLAAAKAARTALAVKVVVAARRVQSVKRRILYQRKKKAFREQNRADMATLRSAADDQLTKQWDMEQERIERLRLQREMEQDRQRHVLTARKVVQTVQRQQNVLEVEAASRTVQAMQAAEQAEKVRRANQRRLDARTSKETNKRWSESERAIKRVLSNYGTARNREAIRLHAAEESISLQSRYAAKRAERDVKRVELLQKFEVIPTDSVGTHRFTQPVPQEPNLSEPRGPAPLTLTQSPPSLVVAPFAVATAPLSRDASFQHDPLSSPISRHFVPPPPVPPATARPPRSARMPKAFSKEHYMQKRPITS